jgi:N-acetylglucosamine malate deacetylase 1
MGIKKLIISPHADDEVLGCGGILDKDSFVYFCGIDESKMAEGITPVNESLEAVKNVAKFLGFQFDVNKDSKVNWYDERNLISIFEGLFNKLRPEMVFLPCPDYNQDHRAVFNAAVIALRPHDKNFYVKKVLIYETSQNAIWNPTRPMNLNYFAKIDIERKIKAYGFYKTEVRKMRSPEMMTDVAQIRGRASNNEYAEAFEVLRWVE